MFCEHGGRQICVDSRRSRESVVAILLAVIEG